MSIYKPKITIISVCYNVAEDLAKTIKSISQQTYQNIEYIIVDGASKDNTINLIAENSALITQWISEPDRGIYDAMNKGIDMATGDWIIFMNAGDVFYNADVISKVFSNEFENNVKLIYGDVMLDFGVLGVIPKKLGKIKPEHVPFEICHQSVFTKADILKQLHYDTSFRICADCNSFLKIFQLGYKLVHVPVFISKFEVVNGVSSKKIMQSYFEHCKVKDINPFSLTRIPLTCKTFIKSILLSFLPENKYNKLRFNSVRSRDLYK